MLGVALSNQNLFSALVESPGSETILFQSKLEPSMAGKMVSVAGQVISVAQRQTRNDRPFLIATLGMMDGPIEVAVWENVLKETPGLWEEGRLVSVKGTVRERDEQLSISCKEADEYLIGESGEAESASLDGDAKSNGAAPTAGGAAKSVSSTPASPAPPAPPAPPPPPAPSARPLPAIGAVQRIAQAIECAVPRDRPLRPEIRPSWTTSSCCCWCTTATIV